MFFFGFIELIILFAVIYAVWYVVTSRRRRREALRPSDPGIGTVRRLYFYLVSLVALIMAVNGLVQIVRYPLDSLFGPETLAASRTGLAVGISLAVVGLPLWAFHWRTVQRHVARLPVEMASPLRKTYVYVVLGVSVGLAAAAAVSLLEWAFDTRGFSGYSWAALAAWTGVWTLHWRWESAEGQPGAESLGVRRLYLYLVSAAGLVMVALDLGQVMYVILVEGYQSIAALPVLLPADNGLWRPSMRDGLSLGLVGGALWGSHWFYLADRDHRSLVRRVYLYVFALLGGAVTVMVSLGFIINGLLTWMIGAPPDDAAASHFRFLPGAVAGLAVGVGIWTYHWNVIRQEAERSAVEARVAERVYAYAVTAIGLAALVVAVGVMVGTGVGVLAESSRELLSGQDLWRKPIALAITLLLLGLPPWAYYWTAAERMVGASAVEGSVLARRVFIFPVLAAGSLALLGAGSFVLFVFFREVLEGDLSLDVLRDAKVGIGVLAAAVLFLPYHWLVYQRDRRTDTLVSRPEEGVGRKDVTVLVPEGADELVRLVEAALGYEVDVLLRADPGVGLPVPSEDESGRLARRINQARGQSVLIVADGTDLRILSYD